MLNNLENKRVALVSDWLKAHDIAYPVGLMATLKRSSLDFWAETLEGSRYNDMDIPTLSMTLEVKLEVERRCCRKIDVQDFCTPVLK